MRGPSGPAVCAPKQQPRMRSDKYCTAERRGARERRVRSVILAVRMRAELGGLGRLSGRELERVSLLGGQLAEAEAGG